MAAIRVAHLASIQVFADATARDAFTSYEEGDMCYVIGVGLQVYKSGTWETIALVSDLS